MKNLIVNTYSIYLSIAIVLVFLVARIFFKNSKIFMLDIFRGREEIAHSTNRLFETGFYLLNLGFAFLFMKITQSNFFVYSEELNKSVFQFNEQNLFETLSYKVGALAIFLGLMVFFNLYMLFRGKKKSKLNSKFISTQPIEE